jgi:hypothetical protein
MQCFFCPNPAAHPSTGCQYTDRVLACENCTRECWQWVRRHINKKGRRPNRHTGLRSDFYRAAGKWLGQDGRRVPV